jgi:hypothetical protein
MSTSVHCTAEIAVGLPRDKAMALFTPEGERRWAAGWDPHYSQGGRRDGLGTVFTTTHGGSQATWVMVDRLPQSIRYARVVPAMTAGTIAVEVVSSHEAATQVRVTYDLTALSPAGERWLEAFDAAYQAEIASWAIDIAVALEHPPTASERTTEHSHPTGAVPGVPGTKRPNRWSTAT